MSDQKRKNGGRTKNASSCRLVKVSTLSEMFKSEPNFEVPVGTRFCSGTDIKADPIVANAENINNLIAKAKLVIDKSKNLSNMEAVSS